MNIMLKTFFLTTFVFSFGASAQDYQLKDIKLDRDNARTIISILNDAGQDFVSKKNINTLQVDGISCLFRHRGAWDESLPISNVSTTHCYKNIDISNDPFHTEGAVQLSEGHALGDTLDAVLTPTNDGFDCAMGKCALGPLNVKCVVDTALEIQDANRFQCTLQVKDYTQR